MRYSRRHTRITYEGLSFLAILAFIILGSILRQINLLVLLSGLMIAPFFFNWRISLKMLERVRFARRLPNWAHAGTPFNVQWIAENDRPRVPSWELKISDRLVPQGRSKQETERVDVMIPQIRPLDSTRVSYRCLITTRGIYEFGPAIASSAFPVGLARSRTQLNQIDSLIVAPQLGHLTHHWRNLTQSAAAGLKSDSRRRGNSNDEFFALRSWQSGDARRHIHWRSSAKRGELMVKQFDHRTDRDYGVLLDLWADDVTPPELIERAVSFMATIVNNLEQQIKRESVVAILGNQSVVIQDRMSRLTIRQLMHELAVIEPTTDTQVAQQLRGIAESTQRNMTMFVLSTRTASQSEAVDRLSTGNVTVQWIEVGSPTGKQLFRLKDTTDALTLAGKVALGSAVPSGNPARGPASDNTSVNEIRQPPL